MNSSAAIVLDRVTKVYDEPVVFDVSLDVPEGNFVTLARALVLEPAVLLLDEPLTGLDERLRQQLRDEIGRLHRRLGATFLAVTHNHEEALSLSDRIAVLRRGRIEQIGAPRELFER